MTNLIGIIHLYYLALSKQKIVPDDIYTISDLNKLLKLGCLLYPQIRLISDNGACPRGFAGFIKQYSRPDGFTRSKILFDVLDNLINRGATLIIDHIHDFNDPMKAMVGIFERRLNLNVNANLYYSKQGGSSFGDHFDDHDVYAVQLYGKKKWVISNPSYKFPNRGDKSFYVENINSKGATSFYTNPGDLLYIPAGFWHNVETCTPSSLHISFAIDFYRVSDSLLHLFESLKSEELIRSPLTSKINQQDIKNILIDKIKNSNFSYDFFQSISFLNNGERILK